MYLGPFGSWRAAVTPLPTRDRDENVRIKGFVDGSGTSWPRIHSRTLTPLVDAIAQILMS